MGKQYRITKEECRERIRGICNRCGGPLEPIETVDNSHNPTFWAGCMACHVFTSGTSEKIYKIATTLVLERHYHHYLHLQYDPDDDEETRLYKQREQIGSICDLVAEVLAVEADLSP